MKKIKFYAKDVSVECPRAIALSAFEKEKSRAIGVANGKGTKVDDIIEELVLSIIHSTRDRTITTQLDLSKTYNVVYPPTEEKYVITITGRPDIIVNQIVSNDIVNKIIEVKYFPGYNEPIPAHVRQVSMYYELYKSNTRKTPEPYIQYFSISKAPLIKKLLIENAKTYPHINSDLVKLFKIPPEKAILALKETVWNISRGIAFYNEGIPFGTFDCYMCPYFNTCKANITIEGRNITEKTSFWNIAKRKFVIDDNYIKDPKVREATSAAIIMYHQFIDQLSIK